MNKIYGNFLSVDFGDLIFSLKDLMNEFFNSAVFAGGLFTFKIIAALFSISFFVFIIVTILKIKGMRSKPEKSSANSHIEIGEFEDKWKNLSEKFRSSRVNDQKLALIEADKMLDDTLRRIGYSGESMGDRLKQLDGMNLPNINDVWEAHKIRNRVVHNPEYEPNKRDVEFSMRAYEIALRDLKA